MKKKLLIILPLIILLMTGFIFLVPVKNGRTIYKTIKYKQLLDNAIQPDNYDKMKISYARITERKTGTPNFNTPSGASVDDGSLTSNMDGIDVSEKDDYVRTNDILYYMIEVGAELNLDNPDVNESTTLEGGVIKVKATLPTDADGNPLFTWSEDLWMRDVTISDDGNTLYASYVLPKTSSLVNGNQQLSFTISALREEYELTENNKPTFEIWMEGNEPDNESSEIESITIKDENNIFITGVTAYNLKMHKGTINQVGKNNGVRGQYINFYPSLKIYNSHGSSFKTKGASVDEHESMYTKIKVEYYYRNINDNDGTFTKFDEEYINGDNIKLIAANANTSDYYNEDSPLFSNYADHIVDGGYIIHIDGHYDYYQRSYDSGNFDYTYENGVITTTNTNFYNYLNYNETSYTARDQSEFIFSNAIEFFFPYINDGNDYDYQVKFIYEDFGSGEDSFYEDSYLSDNTLTISFSDYLLGNITSNLYSDTSYYGGKDTSYVVNGKITSMQSILSVTDEPYEGGAERLITFNSSMVELTSQKGNYYTYCKDLNCRDVINQGTMKYGVYKENPSEGLTTNALINSTLQDDFDWYTDIYTAKQHGAVTALLFDEPDYRGSKTTDYLEFFLQPNMKNAEENYGKTTIVRQKVWLYGDEERTKSYERHTDTSENYYIPTEYNDQVVLISQGSPATAGETIRIDPGFVHLTTRASFDKGTYNVADEKMRATFTTTYSSTVGKMDYDTDTLNVSFTFEKEYISYKPGACNIEPTEVNEWYSETNLIWRIDNVPVEGPYPIIYCDFDINPYTPNNSSVYMTMDSSYLTKHTTLGFGSGYWYRKYISNLSGSNTRKVLSKNSIEKNGEFDVSGVVYNISEDILNNIKTVEILPKNGDEIGNVYNGSYSLKLISKTDNIKVYYATGNIDDIGIEKDAQNNYHIQNVDLENDARWTEIDAGDTIPSEATAIASLTNSLLKEQNNEYVYHVTTTNNQYGDTYYFGQYASSDNLTGNLFSTYKKISIIDRRITGTVFDDADRNNIYNRTDKILKNVKIELLNEEGEKIAETTSDNQGTYEFKDLENGSYYIKLSEILDGYELISKGTIDSSSKINDNLITDLINHTYESNNAIESISNINIGMRKKEATLIVKHLDKNNNEPLSAQTEKTVYYTDRYYTYSSYNIPQNYAFLESAGDPTDGIVNKDVIEVIYYYDYKPSTVTARHYKNGTSTKIHEDVVQNKKYTQEYSTSPVELADYEFVKTTGDSTSGIINKAAYYVNYYYKLKTGTVTTHHYLYDNGDTTTKLAPDVTKTWNYTETYTTSTSNEVPANYEFYKKSDNYTNIMSSPSVEVNYYYRLKDSNLTTTITKTGDEEITAKDSEVNYTIKYNATVKDYIGNGTITIVDNLPYKIDVDASNLAGGTYNETDKTITWTESWNNINSYNETNEEAKKEIQKNIKLVYVGIVGRDRVMTNSTVGNIVLSNNSRDAQAQTSTNIKIKGKIKVTYKDKDTGEELFDTIEEEDLVGEQFISSSQEKEGYKLVTKPDSEEFEFEEEDQLIEYEYEHIKFEIKGVVLGVGGTITGDEDVFWGEDSTVDNIVVQADEGYIIEAIIVNGERIELVLGEEKIILNNFVNVTEDKNIEVVFAKKPQENPNTKASLGWLLFFSWIVAILSFILLKKTKELE